ncbi:MAG: hypothetical protein A3J65_01250 [Candidatus Buchananbacteria bacterium RIFCSPHIGHO2_02_FULL_45_11b]|uniref:VanZ-like domain-containing protein n=2 Tax=Candidatus Buchananiibacteriota TaxID=1817903 RepID=A0A1G1YJR3_9BACT|nr:MAG: hypothetical protein A3J65_01250 [Candidatus Buchananbacteria bacterium RIFCSPHIGHO2_02_FULL_45_11b]OGY56515.1 MAG: hypothetical protein A3H67_03550 [Candidatus Buchananbacteria bacterium RIFCSPLOWO2_02_FULL_46_11b]
MLKNHKSILNWLAVIGWLMVIYYFSSQPNLKSELEPLWDLIFRKIAHLAEYFVLAFLLFRALLGHKAPKTPALALALILSLFYAFTDEYHQSFTAGRSASLVDAGIDGLGPVIFTGLKLFEKDKLKS